MKKNEGRKKEGRKGGRNREKKEGRKDGMWEGWKEGQDVVGRKKGRKEGRTGGILEGREGRMGRTKYWKAGRVMGRTDYWKEGILKGSKVGILGLRKFWEYGNLGRNLGRNF